MQRCLIVGGNGFIGSHITEHLVRQGYKVRVYTRPGHTPIFDANLARQVEWVEGDFRDKEAMDAAMQDCDYCFHLVSTTIPKSSNDNPTLDVETNVIGTLQLLDLAVKHRLQKVIFLSSGGTVYGIPSIMPIPVNHTTDPVCSYGITKLAIEKYLHLYYKLHGLDYCILRLSNPFGERQKIAATQGAVAVFLGKALKNEPVEIWGDGSVTRDYIYIADVAAALVKAIKYKGDVRVFNIGAGIGLSLNDLLDEIEIVIGRKVSRRYLPGRPFDVPISVLDISATTAAMGWRPMTPFREGLIRTTDWLIQYFFADHIDTSINRSTSKIMTSME